MALGNRGLMAESNQNAQKGSDPAVSKEVSDFAKTLTPEQRMLVILKKQLYGGQWEPMLDDLRNRLDGKPYIFKLANRIQDDIERIEKMSAFEKENGIDLADFVDLS
jgi:hypothetical protein